MKITVNDVRRLQSQVRWQCRLSVAALLAAAALAVAFARSTDEDGAATVHEVLRAQRFVIVSPEGQEFGELTHLGDSSLRSGPGLYLRDSQGEVRISLFVDAWEKAWLQLRDGQGQLTIEARVTAEGEDLLRANQIMAREDLKLRGMPLQTPRLPGMPLKTPLD